MAFGMLYATIDKKYLPCTYGSRKDEQATAKGPRKDGQNLKFRRRKNG